MSAPKSRWANADEPETDAILAQRKREKEAKRRAKAERQRKVEQDQQLAERQQISKAEIKGTETEGQRPPAKRRRLSTDSSSSPAATATTIEQQQQQKSTRAATTTTSTLLHFPTREWGPCRHVDNFERLNHIEEGSYGWVSRARDINTGDIIALKKLKMDNSPDGFPITGLREIQTLQEARHRNIVYLREIVMGTKMTE